MGKSCSENESDTQLNFFKLSKKQEDYNQIE